MESSKPKEDRTKIISTEKFWDMNEEQRETFQGFHIDKVSVTYAQKVQKDFEDLIIETEDSGGGRYIVLKTEKFSINDAHEIEDIIKDFMIRAQMIKA